MSGMGKRIRAARIRKGLTQTQLAELAGVASHTTISDYESGKRGGKRPEVEFLLRVCKALDISIDYLFLGKEQNVKK